MDENKEINLNCPKFLLCDLKKCKKDSDTNWNFEIQAQYKDTKINKTIKFKTVYVQGFIEQKPCDDVMILKDSTGKVKLSNCTTAVRKSQNNIIKGAYCSVTGTLIRETGLPEISAHKVTRIENVDSDQNTYYNYWPFEVKDFKLFVLGVIKPNLN